MALLWALLFVGGFTAQVQSESAAASFPLPSFSEPPVASRPKFRYWIPDASVPASAVQSDIAALAAASAGGLEFLGFFNQGFPPISTDWSVYGFGTKVFKDILKAALQTTVEHGLRFDFAIGPNTGAGVPAVPRTEGLAMELVYGARVMNASDKAGALPPPMLRFNHGPLDGWVHEPENFGPSELVAVVAAQVKSRGRKSGGRDAAEQVVLYEDSVVDLTTAAKNGAVDWEAPRGGGKSSRAGSSWVLLAFYQRFSNERSCVSVSQASTWIGNGSWALDHFSAAGAKKATDFWDQHLLDDKEINDMIGRAGMYCSFSSHLSPSFCWVADAFAHTAWEDSMEMMATLWWTPDFLSRFEKARGYSAVKYLPVFFQAKNMWNSYGEPYDTSYVLDGPSDGAKYAEDYRLTLSEGYQDYLAYFQQWAAGRGLDHSAQPAYNMPLDMASAHRPPAGLPYYAYMRASSLLQSLWSGLPNLNLLASANPSTTTDNSPAQPIFSAGMSSRRKSEHSVAAHMRRRYPPCSASSATPSRRA